MRRLSVAILWLVYGAIVGILIELGFVWGVGTPKPWESPGILLAAIFVVAASGMIAGFFQYQRSP